MEKKAEDSEDNQPYLVMKEELPVRRKHFLDRIYSHRKKQSGSERCNEKFAETFDSSPSESRFLAPRLRGGELE